MNLWTVFIFSITFMQRIADTYTPDERTKWKLIQKDLDELTEESKASKYWTSKYQEDLRLYTARTADFNGTCKQHIFDCYCEEFKVVLEEISLSGDETRAKRMTHTLTNMQNYSPSASDTTGSCKKCEELEETSFQEFLESFHSITQENHSES
ncbi:hypothetical protein GDO78_011879 [Eleutherodactylus coqui]|uniref:Interleukin n=1 Tax=Eleutherodactylus coqui TaxID=57060 RepID=A0A8J6F497_ELECQ|nr:hypothetical protein GDO78_011879 [Eleutherodactylus coqui]